MQQIIYVDRKKYAVNLVWQPVADGFSGRDYARKLESDLDKKFNSYSEYHNMVCLGSTKYGQRNGMPVAAPEIIESLSEYPSFLAGFKNQNNFWLIAVRNGVVLEDKLFQDEAAAKEEYKKLFEIPDWDELIAPGSWEIPKTTDKILENIISGNVNLVLKPISKFKSNFIAIVLIVVFAVAIIQFFKQPLNQIIKHEKNTAKINPALVQEYKKQLEEENNKKNTDSKIKQSAVNSAKQEEVILPYDVLPNPVSRAKLCYKSIGFLMQKIAGWKQTKLECRETYTDVVFKRDFGNIDDFYKIIKEKMPGVSVQTKSESEIYVKTNLPLLPAKGSIEKRDVQTIVRNVNAMFQKLGSRVDIDTTTDTFNNNEKSWSVNVIEISAESKMIPQEFIKIFDDFSGVYMNLAAWNAESKTWNYEVIIYAK